MHETKGTLIEKWLLLKRYYAINYSVYKMNPHQHAEYEIMYNALGQCTVIYTKAEELNKEILLRDGEFIFLNQMVKHELRIEKGKPCRVLNLEIGLDKRRGAYSIHDIFPEMASLPDYWVGKDKSGRIHEAILSLQKEQSIQDKNSLLANDSLLTLLAVELRRAYCRMRQNQNQGRTYYVRKAYAFIAQNYMNAEISITMLCKELGISQGYLHRIYVQETGETIVQTITTLRIEKAKFLLSKSALSIVDIAFDVGFNHRQHFSSTFLKLVGCSPREYRKKKENISFFEGFD